MKKLFSMLLCGAMLVSFSACEKNEPTDGSTNSGINNNGSTDSDSNNGDATTGFYNDHAWVDLGLTSGILWATCNVGATSPQQYGDYFAWGETKTKENYSWRTYKYGSDASELTKYCCSIFFAKNDFADCKYNLDAPDDAATANWKGKWRMPTKVEQEELLNECRWTWTTDYNGTGVAGYIVTGSNRNFIFLPAAGCYNNSNLGAVGEYGYYWSSDVDTFGCAIYIFFESDEHIWDRFVDRCVGLPVRPVYSPK